MGTRLLEMAVQVNTVASRHGQVGSKIKAHRNAGSAWTVAHEVESRVDQLVEMHRDALRWLLARHGQERLDNAGTAFCRLPDLHNRSGSLWIGSIFF